MTLARLLRGTHVLPLAMFFGTFAWSFVYVSFAQSFVLGGLVLVGGGALVHWGVPASHPRTAADASSSSRHWRETAIVSLLALGGSTQIFFLTSILPQVMTELGVAADRTLEVGGLIIFASGAAASLSLLAAPRLAELLPERRLIAALLVGSSVMVGAPAVAPGAWSYGVLRFVQVLCIAPVFPIVVSRAMRAHVPAVPR